jgi:polyhydroxyalkanoate synthase
LPADTVAELVGGVPGSLLDVASCAGAPEEFVAGRWQDAFASLLEPEAFLVHQRVIRWTLDEFAQPARLFAEIVEQLYRADAFARGELRLAGKKALPEALAQLPVATVINETSRVVPPASSLGPLSKPEVFTYKPEVGVALQHVGPLVGRRAHRELWPRLVECIK